MTKILPSRFILICCGGLEYHSHEWMQELQELQDKLRTGAVGGVSQSVSQVSAKEQV